MSCPTELELQDCLLGKLPEARMDKLLEHAETCEVCKRRISAAEAMTDPLVASLQDQERVAIASSDHCDRMIQRAEQLVPATGTWETPSKPKNHLLQGTRVRDYEILRPIGEGGMGAVFLAKHIRLERNVAVKVLSLGRQHNAEAQKRFEQEMQIVGQLQHPGIVQALDAGEDRGIQYLVMEVVDGADLRHLVRLAGPLELADACEVTFQVAKALEYAHSRKLIHRDIKPSNVMLSREGIIKVMDLGIAKFADQQHALTSTQQALGSLDFMAPEQLQAESTDGRADVFALGCTFHFLLTGEPPERRRTAALLVSNAPRLEGLRHQLPPPLTRLLQQMLLPDPRERCDSMTEVADRIKPFCGSADLPQLASKSFELLSHEERGQAASRTSQISRKQPASWRGKLNWFAGITTILALLALSAIYFGWSEGRRRSLLSLPSASSNINPIREIPLFQIHEQAIRCVAFCEDTDQLVVGDDDGRISIRDLPNQEHIQCLRFGDQPIIDLALSHEVNRLVVLDAAGTVGAIDLPDAKLAWAKHPPPQEPAADSIAISIRDEILITGAGKFLRALQTDKGIELQSEPDETFDNRDSVDVAKSFRLIEADIELCKAMSSTRDAWVVSKGRRVWLLPANGFETEDKRVFVYAEHLAPISALFTFETNSMVLTGDESGQIRLWQAPQTRYSDMLLGCATRIDSMEMTFALSRNRWGKSAFLPAVSTEDNGRSDGMLNLKKVIERDTIEHRLQFREVPVDELSR